MFKVGDRVMDNTLKRTGCVTKVSFDALDHEFLYIAWDVEPDVILGPYLASNFSLLKTIECESVSFEFPATNSSKENVVVSSISDPTPKVVDLDQMEHILDQIEADANEFIRLKKENEDLKNSINNLQKTIETLAKDRVEEREYISSFLDLIEDEDINRLLDDELYNATSDGEYGYAAKLAKLLSFVE